MTDVFKVTHLYTQQYLDKICKHILRCCNGLIPTIKSMICETWAATQLSYFILMKIISNGILKIRDDIRHHKIYFSCWSVHFKTTCCIKKSYYDKYTGTIRAYFIFLYESSCCVIQYDKVIYSVKHNTTTNVLCLNKLLYHIFLMLKKWPRLQHSKI
jgi:hypothetical protein